MNLLRTPLSPGHPLWKPVVFFLALVYVSGVIGMQTDARSWFVQLTPANLLLSSGVLLWGVPQWTRPGGVWLIAAALIGFLAELIGVNTGLLFGVYEYGAVLGLQWERTPLLIALNWMLVTYVANDSLARWASSAPFFLRAAAAATLCTLLDVLIEPVAIRLGYWHWEAGTPPVQNYVAWWGVSFFIALLWPGRAGFPLRNPLTLLLLGLQVFFFVAGLFLF